MQYPWPHDSRVAPRPPPRRAPRKYLPPSHTIQREDIPTIQVGGNFAVTLVKQGRRLEWEVLADEDDHDSRAGRTQSTQIYPKTLVEGPPPPEITAYQRAEQSARFLRDFYPDLDIPFDVLQGLVMEDHSGSERATLFDPYAGNRLVAVTIDSPFGPENSRPSPISFLAFVSGEGGSGLNISAFGRYNGNFAPLIACPNILKDFEKPILQISGLSTSNGVCAIAVRTPNDLVVCQLVPKQRVKENQPPVSLKVLGSVELGQPDSRPFMDMIFDYITGESVTHVRLILVDGSGRLWSWSSEDGTTSPTLLIDLPIENTSKYALSSDASHWRLAHSGLVGVVYVVSGRFVGRVDLRESPPLCETVFELHSNDGIFTSVTSTAIDFTLCAATTTKLFWFDTPSGKTVAAWRHDRQSEPGLQVVWMPGVTRPEACLYSLRNNWISVYPMAWSQNQQSETGARLRVHASSNLPRSFLLSSPHNVSRLRQRKGLQLFRHPLQDIEKEESFDVFELTSEQAIFRTRINDVTSSYPDGALRVWSKEVYRMQDTIDEAERSGSKYGPLGLRESRVYDLRSFYERLFLGMPRQDADSEESSTSTIADLKELLENISTISMDPTDEGSALLTFHDIARRAGSERANGQQRSSLFASTAFHSEDGYDALQEACDTSAIPPTEAIAQDAAWHWNISDTLEILCGEGAPVPYRLKDLGQSKYRKFDVAEPEMEDKDPSILEREDASARTLAVDLAMSLDVFSTRPFRGPESSPEETLMGVDAATSMMSKTSIAASKPPPIDFGFLQPELSGVSNSLEMEDVEDIPASRRRRRRRRSLPEEDFDQGARLLLSGWRVGDDPRGVHYVNPYDPDAGLFKKPERAITSTPVPLVQRTTAQVGGSNAPNAVRPQQASSAPMVPALRSTDRAFLYTSAIHEPHGIPMLPASQPDLNGGRDWATQPPDMFDNSLPSVPMLPSTQPVSGTFGSRLAVPTAAKKKKRVSGF